MKKYVLTPFMAVLLVGLVGCEDRGEDPQYPQQPYPQPYPQPQAYPQPYPQPGAYPAPAPAPYPAPAPAPAGGTPTSLPGVLRMADGTCQFTPPSLDPNTPAAPITVPCPP